MICLMTLHNSANARRRSKGLSLVEVIVSAMLVGVVVAGAMTCLGAVIRDRQETARAGLADQLAQQLLAEVLATAYEDEAVQPVFGPDPGEATGDRSAFDDVDDFDGWSASPPVDRSGMPVVSDNRWRRNVRVLLIDPTAPTQTTLADLGLKRIRVTVRYDGQIVSRIVALRSQQYELP